MIAEKGFILVSDVNEDNGEPDLRPYFPFVLNSSIIAADPISIDKNLNIASERWTLVDGIDGVEKTSYIFRCNYENLEDDGTEELTGSNYLSAEVRYDLYRNGYLDVEGVIRLDGAPGYFSEDRKMFLKTFYLPYAVPDAAIVETSYAFGNVEGTTISSRLELEQITNINLNPNGYVRRYYYKLDITELVPIKKDSGVVSDEDPIAQSTIPLDLVYRNVDTGYEMYTYDDYVAKYIPIRFRIKNVRYK